ncbi:MAG: ABC transporter ATP-binding protein [Clostridia bacterium]|nr:ABC transporter ATP-binding protein [Clostridia bacterium]
MICKIKNMLWLMRLYWKYAKVLMIYWFFEAIILEPIVVVANTTIIQIIIGAIIAQKSMGDIFLIIVIYSLLILTISLLRRLVAILYSEQKNFMVIQTIKKDVYNKAIKTDYKYFDDPEFYNNYTSAISQFPNQCSNAVELFFQILSTFTTIASLMALIIMLGPWIVIVTIVTVILSTLVQFKINKKYMDRYEQGLQADRRLNYIHRILYMKEYAADIKTTNLNSFISDKFNSAVSEKRAILKKFSKIILFWTSLYTGIFTIKDVVIISYIVWGIINGTIAHIGMYTTLISASGNLTTSLNRLFSVVSSLDKLDLFAKQIKRFFEFDSTIESSINDCCYEWSNDPLEINMKCVNFQYPNSNFSLKDISMSIPRGSKVAIVGQNGAGKSTLAKLLLRLYDVDHGEIMINGINIKRYQVKQLREHIGIAFQTPNIYALSMSENLRLYNENDESELTTILEQINLFNVLEKNGGTLQSELTKEFCENGMILSKGEQQKLGLARLLSGEFGLILLDEPSSALDPLAEYEMTKLFFDQANKTTTIMIAHRLSTIRNADIIFLIDDGKIIEQGTHEDLMAIKGKYYTMFTKQAENYIK